MIKQNFNSLIWIVITLFWGCTSTPILSQDNSTLTRGIVKELVNGDLMCYVTLIDENGDENIIGASFEICEQPEKYLDKKVNLTYELANINDCESNEPCGKTRQELIIIKMDSIE
ncbi:hypothetical protein [Geminocystis herdmanii]|uniref:hypothetical protein n=1 Tax=Geminocystis herdmanii TaxID=669359 RepID=UPI00034D4C46|nr:hypothetical protein [Geminocystis herdmanii]